jgi:hypothetical protein
MSVCERTVLTDIFAFLRQSTLRKLFSRKASLSNVDLVSLVSRHAVSWCLCPDDRGSTDLWNVGKLIPFYTALQPTRQLSSYSLPWEPQVTHTPTSVWTPGFINACPTSRLCLLSRYTGTVPPFFPVRVRRCCRSVHIPVFADTFHFR